MSNGNMLAVRISILNFWQRPSVATGQLYAMRQRLSGLSLCLLFPCGGAVDQPWLLCLAAWLARRQSLLLGEIVKTHLYWVFV
jgi:hypothetical protein